MENLDAEELNAEMEVQREDFINYFRRFLAETGCQLSLSNFGKLHVKLPEIKSGNQILQHEQDFSIGDFPMTEYTI